MTVPKENISREPAADLMLKASNDSKDFEAK